MTQTLLPAATVRHSFIVRVWHEDSAEPAGGQWRGSIEHVPSGERLHFVSLEAVTNFINQYWHPTQTI